MQTYYQSLRVLQLGLERFRPPRSRGGSTRPLRIVLITIESTSCGVTRPYQIPDPEGVYIYPGVPRALVSNRHNRSSTSTYDTIAGIFVTADVRDLED